MSVIVEIEGIGFFKVPRPVRLSIGREIVKSAKATGRKVNYRVEKDRDKSDFEVESEDESTKIL